MISSLFCSNITPEQTQNINARCENAVDSKTPFTNQLATNYTHVCILGIFFLAVEHGLLSFEGHKVGKKAVCSVSVRWNFINIGFGIFELVCVSC